MLPPAHDAQYQPGPVYWAWLQDSFTRAGRREEPSRDAAGSDIISETGLAGGCLAGC